MFERTVVRRLFGFDLCLCYAVGLVLSWPLAASPPLVQLPELAACVSETGTGGDCHDGVALITANAVAVSPDGRNVYVVATGSDAVASFNRDPLNGELDQMDLLAACTSDDGTLGLCGDGNAMLSPQDLAVSPDGANVYVAAQGSDAVAVFRRSPIDGALSQPPTDEGCVSNDGTLGACIDGTALIGARGVAVSPDGRNVYVAAGNNSIAVFDRGDGGLLTQKLGADGCINESGGGGCVDGVGLNNPNLVTVSADGRQVYVTVLVGDGLALFDRNPFTGVLTQKAGLDACVSADGTMGACAVGVALDGPRDVLATPDGRNVYVTSSVSDAVVVFDRDSASGELTQKAGTAGCVSEDGTGGACADGTALNSPGRLALSGDGRILYVAAFSSSAVAVFDRDLETGELTQKPGLTGCVAEIGGATCTDGIGMTATVGVAVSPVGGHVYAAASQSNAVTAFTTAITHYDIDGNGDIAPLTDAILMLRYQFGFTGNVLIANAFDEDNCIRCTAAAIEDFIETLSIP